MQSIKARPGCSVWIGREGEHKVRQILFDLKHMRGLYGEGHAELIYQRLGDPAPYPVAIEEQSDMAVWTVTATDTSCEGGSAELRWYSGEKLAKSEVYLVEVSEALEAPEHVPDPPGQTWLDRALDAGAEAKSSVAAAQDAEKGAVEARNAATEAAKEAEIAASQPPMPMESTGTWWVWSKSLGAYRDTGISAYGPAGPQGDTGPQGPAGPQGKEGMRGTSYLFVDSVPETGSFTFSGVTYKNRLALDTILREASVEIVLSGDTLVVGSTDHYRVLYVTYEHAYTADKVSVKGAQGPAGPTGSTGADGRTPVKGTDYWTAEDREEMAQQASEDVFGKMDWVAQKTKVEGSLYVLSRRAVTFESDNTMVTGTQYNLIVRDGKYVVSWNSVDYLCIGKIDGDGGLYLGNGNLIGVEDDGEEPFCILNYGGTGSFIYKDTNTAETIILSVVAGSGYEYNTLPVEYLPMDEIVNGVLAALPIYAGEVESA